MATGTIGEGKPAKLNLRSRVTDIDCKNATLTLENGEVFCGDVIVGADGVHVRSLEACMFLKMLTQNSPEPE